jgi:hypothetical protein
MLVGDVDNWMACTDQLRLRLLRADDAVPLRSVMEPGLVEAVVARTGNRALTPWAIVLLDGYGSCRSLSWQFVGVGVPAPVGLLGLVLVAAPPQRPGGAVRLVAPGLGDDGPAELSEQLRNGNGD